MSPIRPPPSQMVTVEAAESADYRVQTVVTSCDLGEVKFSLPDCLSEKMGTLLGTYPKLSQVSACESS